VSLRGAKIALDASPMINLLATGSLAEILEATGAHFVAAEQAVAEVRRHSIDGSSDPMEVFLTRGVLRRLTLSAESLETFVTLVSDKPDDLGDGEAATIALAQQEGLGVVLDDRKARRVCADRYPDVRVFSSVELFQVAEVEAILGAARLKAVIFDALRIGKMRVRPDEVEWIRELLTEEQIAQCSSLKRPRTR
jgi:predicted nucleic acid-binding protein